MNNAVFRKAVENVKKQRHQTCDKRNKKELFGIRTKLSYTTIFFRKFISHSNEKTQILMNTTVYLGQSILEMSKIVMYEFWYDYVKPKYGEKDKLCCIGTSSFMVYRRDVRRHLKKI